MASLQKTIVVVLADLSTNFEGSPSPLARPFGQHPSVLGTTVARLVEARLAPIVVAWRDIPANAPIRGLLEGLSVEAFAGAAKSNEVDLVLGAVEAMGAENVLVVDGGAPFVSATVARAVLARHEATNAELTFAPLAACGLAPIAVARRSLGRLSRALDSEVLRDPTTCFGHLCESLRAAFDSADAAVPADLMCVPANLQTRTWAQAEQLEPFALPASVEAYGPIFDALCAREWQPAPRRPRPQRGPRPKILFFHYTNRVDPGSTRSLQRVLAHWPRDRYDIGLILPTRGEFYEIAARDMPVRQLPMRWLGAAVRVGARPSEDVLACAALLEEERPDVVFVSGTAPVVAAAARLAGIPAICYLYVPIMKIAAGLLAHRADLALFDVVVAPSHLSEQQLRQAFRPPPGRLTGVQHGIPLDDYESGRADRAAARRRLGLPEEARIALLAGMLVSLKQPHLAIEAMPALLREVPDALLAVAGAERVGSGYAHSLGERAAQLGVAHRVRFMGFVEDMHAAYAACDTLLHCAVGDQFPQVIPEAMTMGRPVVAVADGGAVETVAPGETGLLVDAPGAPDDIARALAEVLRDPERARSMGEAGRTVALARFGANQMVERLERLCATLIAGELPS